MMKCLLLCLIFVLAVRATSTFFSCDCGTSSSTFDLFPAQKISIISDPTSFNFKSANLQNRYFGETGGYYVGDRLLIAWGVEAAAVKTDGEIDFEASAVAFEMDTFCTAELGWFFADVAGDIDVNSGKNLSLAASAAFLGFVGRAFAIIEFEDTNDEEGYQATDKFLTGYDLSSCFIDWCDIATSVTEVSDSDGNPIKVRSAAAVTADKVFGFRATSVGAYATINGENVDPNTIKIEFIINYFNNPCLEENLLITWPALVTVPSSCPTSQIALVTGYAAIAEAFATKNFVTDPNGNSNDKVVYGVSDSASSIYGFYSYEASADATVSVVGGVKAGAVAVFYSTPLNGSDPTGHGYFNPKSAILSGVWAAAAVGSVGIAVFSFNATRPNNVYWDPSAGGSSSSQVTLSISILLCFFILYLLKKY